MLAKYYHSIKLSSMPRMTLIHITLYVLYFVGHSRCVANDFKSEIHRTIEKQRQTERIKAKILFELEKNGANLQQFESMKVNTEEDPTVATLQDTSEDVVIVEQEASTVNSNPMVSIGEPASQNKNRCLLFKVGKYVKNVERIYPFRIDLWVHLRVRGNRKGKQKKKDKQERVSKTTRNMKNDQKIRKDKTKNEDINKKGRRIKIFVSDGKKNLVKYRMRISKTQWYKIELPISQFPDVISANDTFTLCFKCKRCKKKIKLDLHRKSKSERHKSKNPKIPFIHFETRSRSPHPIYRSRRSIVRHHHLALSDTRQDHSCCLEEVYREDISKTFPSILYPRFINISMCSVNSDYSSNRPILSQINSSQKMKCVPKSSANLHISFLSENFSIKNSTIRHIIPTGCICKMVS